MRQINKRIIFLSFISLLFTYCTNKPSSFSSPGFSTEKINRIGIIKEKYIILEGKSLGLPEEDVEAGLSVYKKTNELVKSYFAANQIQLTKIPDSLLTKKEIYQINDYLIDLCIYAERKKADITNESIDERLDLTKFGQLSGTQYLIFWICSGYYESTVAKVLRTNPYNDQFTMTIGIIDAYSSELLWYCKKYAQFNPLNHDNIDATVKAILFNLLYQKDVTPESFVSNNLIGNQVHVYLNNGSEIEGTIKTIDLFNLDIENIDKSNINVSYIDIKFLRGRYDNEIYFPVGKMLQLE